MAKVTSLDLVRRNFHRPQPNQLWLTDITEHPTREGKVYFCAVLDVFSRRVVGWSIDSTQTSRLVMNALGMATEKRHPNGELVIHSDRGSQFASWAFSRKVKEAGLAPSMGSVGSALRQRHDGELLGQDAGRTTEPKEVEDPDRAGQLDPRLHRDLPQHSPPAQLAEYAHPGRIRTPTRNHNRRLIPETRVHFSGGRSGGPTNGVRSIRLISAHFSTPSTTFLRPDRLRSRQDPRPDQVALVSHRMVHY